MRTGRRRIERRKPGQNWSSCWLLAACGRLRQLVGQGHAAALCAMDWMLRMAAVCFPWAALRWQLSGMVDGGAVASSRVRRQRRLSHFEVGMMAFAAYRTSR